MNAIAEFQFQNVDLFRRPTMYYCKFCSELQITTATMAL